MSSLKIDVNDKVLITRGTADFTKEIQEGTVTAVCENKIEVLADNKTYSFMVSVIVEPETSEKKMIMTAFCDTGVFRCFRTMEEISIWKQKYFQMQQAKQGLQLT